MVAEVETKPDQVAEYKPLPYQIPLDVKLKVKSLYLFRSLTHEQIAKETKLSVKQVGWMISREGWVAEKREREQILTDSHDAQASAAQSAVISAIAGQAEEIALSGLNRARDAVTRKGKDAAKNFQSWTGGIKNLVGAIKTIRGNGSSLGDDSGAVMNVFFMRLEQGAAKPEAKVVSPSAPIDV